jgi:hypothetical protein
MNRIRGALLIYAFAIWLSAWKEAKAAEVLVSTREELVQALRQAQAGTTIRVASGTYQGGLYQAHLRGAKDAPIVIAGANAADPPVIEGGGNGIHLSSPTYVELRDLVITGATGNGLNIDDAGAITTPAHNVILHNVVVRDIGPTGNRDAIKLSGVKDFRIDGCTVQRWAGSAIDMVGCHNGTVIACTFRDGNGDAANGVQAKGGSTEIAVRRCRFQNAGGRAVNVGGSTGLAYFRPPNASFEARNITVEDCEFIGGLAAIAFVGVDGALVQHNTIYRPRRWPVRILQENVEPPFVPCRNGRFIKNVVAFRSDEVREVINIGVKTAPETFEFSGNVWYCIDRPAETRRPVRLPVRETEGSYGADPGFKDPDNGDVRIADRTSETAGVRP